MTFFRLKIYLSYKPAIPLLGMYLETNKHYNLHFLRALEPKDHCLEKLLKIILSTLNLHLNILERAGY